MIVNDSTKSFSEEIELVVKEKIKSKLMLIRSYTIIFSPLHYIYGTHWICDDLIRINYSTPNERQSIINQLYSHLEKKYPDCEIHIYGNKEHI